jgi:hypothetical protein
MEKTDYEKSCNARRSRGIALGRLTGNSGRSRKRIAVADLSLLPGGILALAAALVLSPTIRADNNDDEITTFTVDVAQIGTTNAQNNVDPAEGDKVFSRGDTFILGGNIYKKGELQRGRRNNDPTKPGIGTYTMRGTYTGTPDRVPIVAFSTELFELSDGSILIDGPWPNEGFSAHRIVLGGTGRFRYSVGEVYEENLGLNKDQFCNLRVTFRLKKVSGRHDQ